MISWPSSTTVTCISFEAVRAARGRGRRYLLRDMLCTAAHPGPGCLIGTSTPLYRANTHGLTICAKASAMPLLPSEAVGRTIFPAAKYCYGVCKFTARGLSTVHTLARPSRP